MNLIYGLVDPRTSHFRYIGLSTRGMARPRCHLNRVPKRYTNHCANWLRNLKADGFQPEIRVIEYCTDEKDLSEAEAFWIAHFRMMGCPLTNLTDGGFTGKPSLEVRQRVSQALTGIKRSSETIELMRQVKIGDKNPMFGKTYDSATSKQGFKPGQTAWNRGISPSPETCQQISQTLKGNIPWNKGKKLPELSGENHPRFGKHHTPESKAKMSQTKRGMPQHPNSKAVQFQKGLVPWNKGKKCSGMSGKQHTPETKDKISQTKKARKDAK